MNKTQRKQLNALICDIQYVKDSDDTLEDKQTIIGSAVSNLEIIRDDEQDKLDNLPENLQWSSKADAYNDIIEYLDEAIEYLNDAQEYDDETQFEDAIDDAISNIEDAINY